MMYKMQNNTKLIIVLISLQIRSKYELFQMDNIVLVTLLNVLKNATFLFIFILLQCFFFSNNTIQSCCMIVARNNVMWGANYNVYRAREHQYTNNLRNNSTNVTNFTSILCLSSMACIRA